MLDTSASVSYVCCPLPPPHHPTPGVKGTPAAPSSTRVPEDSSSGKSFCRGMLALRPQRLCQTPPASGRDSISRQCFLPGQIEELPGSYNNK